MYQNLELHLDAAIDKVANLTMDVELKKMEKKWDEVYEQEDVDDAVRLAMTLADGRQDPVVMVFGSLSFIGPIIDRAEHGGYIES